MILLSFVILFVGIGCSSSKNNEETSKEHKPVVAVSTFALYDISKFLAQDKIEIIHILPFGVDPHSFEPTPKLMAKIEKADLVIYSGAGLEPWTHGFHFQHKAIDLSQYVALRHLQKKGVVNHEEHHHNGIDPHYWLDFTNMKKMTHVIAQAFIHLLPKEKSFFEANEKKYIQSLDELAQKYQEKLSTCKLNTVVISHNALGYVADKYHFKVDSLTGLSPESQPSAKDITRVMQDIKKEHVTTVFFEHFVNEAIVQSVARDSGIVLEVFQPLGNITADEAKQGLTYKDIMYKNLEKLSKALECK